MASCSSRSRHFEGPAAGRPGACRLLGRPLTAAATLARRGSFPPLLVSFSQQLANHGYSAAAAASGTTGFTSTVAAAASRGVGRGSPAGDIDPPRRPGWRLRHWRSRSGSSGTGGRSGGCSNDGDMSSGSSGGGGGVDEGQQNRPGQQQAGRSNAGGLGGQAPAAAMTAVLGAQEERFNAGGSGSPASMVGARVETSSSAGSSTAMEATMRMDVSSIWWGFSALQQVYGPERLDDIRRSLLERPYDQPIALFDAQEGRITARYRGALSARLQARYAPCLPSARLRIYELANAPLRSQKSFARRLQLRPGAVLRLRGFDTDGHTLVVEVVSAGGQGCGGGSTSNSNIASSSGSASSSSSSSSSSSNTGGGGGIPAAVRLSSNGTCWGKAALTGAIGEERLSEIQHLVTNTGRPYPLTIAVVDPDTGAITDRFSGSLCLHGPRAHTWYIKCSKLSQRLGLEKGSWLQLKGYDEASRTLEVTVLWRGGRSEGDSDSDVETSTAHGTDVSGPAAGVTAAATHQQAPPPPPPPMVSTSAAASPSPCGVGSDGASHHPMAIADHQWQAATAGPAASRGGEGAVPVATSAAAAGPARSLPAAPDRLAPPPTPQGYVEPAAAQLPPAQQGPGGMGHGHAIAAPAPAAAASLRLDDAGEAVEAGAAASRDSGSGGSSGGGGAAAATPPAVVVAEQIGGKRAEEEDDGGERRAAEGGAAGRLSAGSGPLPSQQSAPDPLADVLAALRGVEAARAEADVAATAAAAAAAAAEAAQAAVNAATAEAEVKAAAYLAAVAAARPVGGQARKCRAVE